jgi:hypothetical protein
VLVDQVNGVPPFNWNLFGSKFQNDADVTLFTEIRTGSSSRPSQ